MSLRSIYRWELRVLKCWRMNEVEKEFNYSNLSEKKRCPQALKTSKVFFTKLYY